MNSEDELTFLREAVKTLQRHIDDRARGIDPLTVALVKARDAARAVAAEAADDAENDGLVELAAEWRARAGVTANTPRQF